MKDKLVGVNSIMEAIKSGRKVQKVFLQEGRGGKRITDLLRLAQKRGIYVQQVEKQKLDSMYTSGNHQGVIAVVDRYNYAAIDDVMAIAEERREKPFILVLDGLEDPRNFGAIIRSAECAGVHGIVIPRHNSVEVNETVGKASAGAIEHMLVVRETNLVNLLEYLKKQGMWIIGADINGGSDYFSTRIPEPAAVVIGSEGKGIRRLVREHCDLLLRIPIFGQISSLNASVAAALFLYEIIRQRN